MPMTAAVPMQTFMNKVSSIPFCFHPGKFTLSTAPTAKVGHVSDCHSDLLTKKLLTHQTELTQGHDNWVDLPFEKSSFFLR